MNNSFQIRRAIFLTLKADLEVETGGRRHISHLAAFVQALLNE